MFSLFFACYQKKRNQDLWRNLNIWDYTALLIMLLSAVLLGAGVILGIFGCALFGYLGMLVGIIFIFILVRRKTVERDKNNGEMPVEIIENEQPQAKTPESILKKKRYEQGRIKQLVDVLTVLELNSVEHIDNLVDGCERIVEEKPRSEQIFAKIKPFLLVGILLAAFLLAAYPSNTAAEGDVNTATASVQSGSNDNSEERADKTTDSQEIATDIPAAIAYIVHQFGPELRKIASQSQKAFTAVMILILYLYFVILAGYWAITAIFVDFFDGKQVLAKWLLEDLTYQRAQLKLADKAKEEQKAKINSTSV